MSLPLERQNAYRARYARLVPGWQPATAVYEDLIRRALHDDARVLDLGCGRGGVLEQLDDVALRAIGIDPDTASLREHRLPGLPLAAATAVDLPFAAGTFDLVICAWVLEHLPDPARTLAEVARVLRPGGAFIFLAPNRRSLPALLNRLLRPLQSHLVPRLYGRAEVDTFPVLYRASTPADLLRLAHAAGLTLAECHVIHDPTYFAFHELLFRASVWLTRRLPAEYGVHLAGICRKPAAPA
ncbi:MAG: methyltransferase domain-containing protein [Anaerolineae bacterium]|jgi:SAM-dependent methyltransferase|nr:methyltransferase domain-containing protein [Anaerolineae bacterium]